MSQENVEVIRRLVDAWNGGDREGWLAPSHPEIEWSSGILRQVEGRDAVHRGRAEVGQFWDDWHTLWDLDIEVSEVRDLGDSVLLLAQLRTRGKSSGAEVHRPVGYTFEFEDGLVRRARAYLSPQDALEAAGLRSELCAVDQQREGRCCSSREAGSAALAHEQRLAPRGQLDLLSPHPLGGA